MATKVKPSRLNVSGTPQAGQVPVYVDEDSFQRGPNGTGDVVGPSSSTDGDIVLFDGATGKKIKDSSKKLSDYQEALTTQTAYTSKGTSTKVPTITTNTLGQVTNITETNIAFPVTSVNGDTGAVILDADDISDSNTTNKFVTTQTAYTSKGSSSKVPQITTNTLGQVTGITEVNISYPSQVSDTAYGSGWDGQTTTAPSQNAVYDKIKTIDDVIPTAATSSNKLTDKNYVDDSINSVTAYYITKNANGDQFATYAELAAATTFYSGGAARVPTRNDYTIVLSDENHDNATTRYIYNSGWEYQYTVNETALSQAQLDALNSGITSGKVSTYDGYATSKQDVCNMVCTLTGADNSHYPSAKAVADALSCAGAGDMLKSVYDPNNCNSDAFNYNNLYNKPTIPTDNCQLANSCGYTTCTGTLVASDLTPYAKSCTLCTVATSGKYCDLSGRVTDNCQIGNSCGYTTCTGTLSTCSDVISALGYTPYNSNNPSGYTTCTGTLSTCSDITTALGFTPYSASNPSGYTTCTGTLTSANICDAAFSSAWDGVTTKSPSMNAVYDVLGDVETLLASL